MGSAAWVGIGAGLRGQVDDALLADLRRRDLFEADVDAGQRLELRRQRDQVFKIARRDHRDRDGFAGSLLPVDLGRFVRREVGVLRGRHAAECQAQTSPEPPPRFRF